MALYNKIDRKVLKQKLEDSSEPRITISFYQYHHITDPAVFRDELYKTFDEIGVMGRIYVAKEGINAQISVPESGFESFKERLYAYSFLKGIRLNVAVEDTGKSFFKLKVKVREKILADGLHDETFDVTNKGKHLSAEEFNELIEKEDTILIDMRNHYEHEVGHFKNAVLPDVDTFKQSLPIIEDMLQAHKDKHLVMYCTGGIRCEKASAYFKHKGLEKVYQLEGGIIKYAQDVKKKGLENKFIGKNFVFDERLGERISEEIISHCHQCGEPCDTHTNCVNDACHLLFIQCSACHEKYNQCCSDECKNFIALPEETQKELRKGFDLGQQIFKKGRFNEKAGKFKEYLKSKNILS
jgi:UPF0176 protein